MIRKSIEKLPGAGFEKQASVYLPEDRPCKAAVLYLHGGALIYGDRDDLPDYHIERLCGEGYAVIALDYPLLPSSCAEEILDEVCRSIEWFISVRSKLLGNAQPYFLLGRSAGAYLALSVMTRPLTEKPAGILSYYGYGLLTDGWYDRPSPFYSRYPAVPESALAALPTAPHCRGELSRLYFAYVYLRQSGRWESFLRGSGTTPTLRNTSPSEAPPLFLAHSRGDTDVPFEEFLALTQRFPQAIRFETAIPAHDFDSSTDSAVTHKLLDQSLEFMAGCIGART